MAKDKRDKEEARKAAREYKDARAALRANCDRDRAAGIRHETDEYHRLNDAVIKAQKNLSWWRR